jgi:hypothetical protein
MSVSILMEMDLKPYFNGNYRCLFYLRYEFPTKIQ